MGIIQDLGWGFGTGTGNEGLAGVAGNSADGLLVLLMVGRDLLHSHFVVQPPQMQGAVVALQHQEYTIGVYGQVGGRVQVSNAFPCPVAQEAKASAVVGGGGEGLILMTHHLVDLGWATAPLGLQSEEGTANLQVIQKVSPKWKEATMWAGLVLMKAIEVEIP